MCSRTLSWFEEKFSSQLKATSAKLESWKRSSLSSMVLKSGDRKLTEHNSHWLSYQERVGDFDFRNRFDTEEVEWCLNQPLDIIDGRTCVHLEVLAQRPDKLASLMMFGGKLYACIAYCKLMCLTVFLFMPKALLTSGISPVVRLVDFNETPPTRVLCSACSFIVLCC